MKFTCALTAVWAHRDHSGADVQSIHWLLRSLQKLKFPFYTNSKSLSRFWKCDHVSEFFGGFICVRNAVLRDEGFLSLFNLSQTDVILYKVS